MKFSFTAVIYKTGINPCVDVPSLITDKMVVSRGYIPVKGKIEDHYFEQTLVAVKNAEYRLYVNGLMLKSSGSRVGDTVKFSIEQTDAVRSDVVMPETLKTRLEKENLTSGFDALTPSRKKEILRYLNYLKTEEALLRNIDKVILQLKNRVKKRSFP